MSLSIYAAPNAKIKVTGTNTLIYTWKVDSPVKEQQEYNRFIDVSRDLWDEYQRLGIKEKGMRSAPEAERKAIRAKKDSISDLISSRELKLMQELPISTIWMEKLGRLSMSAKYNPKFSYKEETIALYNRLSDEQKSSIQGQEITVLMLTHDFEPIIDFGVVGKLPEDALNSKFIKNNQGILTEKAIDYKQDIKPVVQALAAYIKDDTLGIVHRIAFLRKYYEHNGIENYKEAYDVLSSLIHGRDKCKYVNNSEMPQAEIQKGCTEIKKWIQNFDYDELYKDVYNEEKLAELYFAETNDYLKIQLFRALFEVNPSREIKEEDVLVKFINESYHIENDYAYYLDMVKFETVPEYIVKAIDDYMERTYSKA